MSDTRRKSRGRKTRRKASLCVRFARGTVTKCIIIVLVFEVSEHCNWMCVNQSGITNRRCNLKREYSM